MCGIIGIWGPLEDKENVLLKACRRIRHRGPDDEGIWQDKRADLGLGHVRLSILDLSSAGHQPMVSECGRYVLVLNGEIYNHFELRKRLHQEGVAPNWRGYSDTETLLAALVAWGVSVTLKTVVGMFALVFWDRADKKLILARDRLGEKPLYYGYINNNFVVASELKAFAAVPHFKKQLERRALTLLMRHHYIPAPWSIYEDIYKLQPASWLEISNLAMRSQTLPVVQSYWSAKAVAEQAIQHPLAFDSITHAVDALETVLAQAVQGQMVADVNLGAFLSGGIDSSVIVAIMQAHSAKSVRTFTIGFHEKAYDEAHYARAVAEHLGTEHTQCYVTAKDALDVIPDLATIYDEPFADASQIPMTLLARLARTQVTVALSGDGGDELFYGYPRYQRVQSWWNNHQSLPTLLRQPCAGLLNMYAHFAKETHGHHKIKKLAQLARAKTPGEFYQTYLSYCLEPDQWLQESIESSTSFTDFKSGQMREVAMQLDAITYLPDDILVKIDRASMAVGLETRVPLLDHRVYEWAWRLPMQYKFQAGKAKFLMRELLQRYVPDTLIDRPKKGFSVPLAAWLRGPLRDWSESLLNESRLQQQGWFKPKPIRLQWHQHLTGQRDCSSQLWSVLMVQAWLENAPASH